MFHLVSHVSGSQASPTEHSPSHLLPLSSRSGARRGKTARCDGEGRLRGVLVCPTDVSVSRALDPPFADDIARVAVTIMVHVVKALCSPPDEPPRGPHPDFTLNTIQALHRIVVDGIRVGITGEIQVGLKMCKQRSDMVKKFFNVMDIPRLPGATRSLVMELVESLASIDKACAIVGSQDALARYATCDLPKISESLSAHQEKTALAVKPWPAKAVPSTDDTALAVELWPANAVSCVELWPEFRGPQVVQTLETDARFFSLCVELASQNVAAAETSGEMSDCAAAVKLIMNIAIDALPGDSSAAIASNLLALLRGVTSSKEGNAGVGGKFSEAVRAESLAGEWTKRVMMVYTFRLREAGVKDTCLQLAREVIPAQFGSEGVKEINEGVIAGIDTAIVANGEGDESERRTQG